MWDKNDIQLDNTLPSPLKPSNKKINQFSNNKNNFHLTQDTFYSNTSSTEKQIYSHQIIKQIMTQRNSHSIHHKIQQIDSHNQLFSKPIKPIQNQFKFNNIPIQNNKYTSTTSFTINQINNKFKQNHFVEKHQHTQSRPRSALSRIQTKNPKISVSGLVTYKFNTVNAKKSLGFNKLNHQQNLINNLKSQQRRKSCSQRRRDSILQRSSVQKYKKSQILNRNIVKDFECDLNNYLQNIIKQQKQNQLLYKQPQKKIQYIQQFMKKQQMNFQDAHFVINNIQKSQQKPIKINKNKNIIHTVDESALNTRKMPKQNTKIHLRHFYFVQ